MAKQNSKEYKGYSLSKKYPEMSKMIIDQPLITYGQYVEKVGKRKAKEASVFNSVRLRHRKQGLETSTISKTFKKKMYELISKTKNLNDLSSSEEIFNFIKDEILEPINKNQKGFKFECVPEGFSQDVTLRLEMHSAR